MKHFILLLFFGITVSGSLQAQKKQKEAFTYPDYIADSARPQFRKDFQKGKLLYGISCGSCHNKTIKGNTVIPDFSLPQLMDYEMRMYTQHEDKLDDRHVSDKELEYIILYLRFKQKSGISVTPPPVLPAGTTGTGKR